MTFNNTLYLTEYTYNSIYPAVHFQKLHKGIHLFCTNSSNSRIFVIYILVWARYKPNMHSHCFQNQECLSLHVRVMADTSPLWPPEGWDRASTTPKSLEISELGEWRCRGSKLEIQAVKLPQRWSQSAGKSRWQRDMFIYYCRRLKCQLCARSSRGHNQKG